MPVVSVMVVAGVVEGVVEDVVEDVLGTAGMEGVAEDHAAIAGSLT